MCGKDTVMVTTQVAAEKYVVAARSIGLKLNRADQGTLRQMV